MYQNWGPEYSIEFDIVVKKLPNYDWTKGPWINVFHVTSTNENCCNKGDRIPGLFINKDGYFQFTTSMNNYGHDFRNISFTLGKIYHVTIKQSKYGSKYWYEFIMN